MRLHIYGNVFYDQVSIISKDGNYSYNSLGGIGNIIPLLDDNDSVYTSFFQSKEYSFAEIIINIDEQTKSSRAFNPYTEAPFEDCKDNIGWSHLVYLDTIKNLTVDIIKQLKENGTVSADISDLGLDFNKELLQYIDVLFVSKEFLIDDMYKVPFLFIKEDDEIIIICPGSRFGIEYCRHSLNNLGAGDIFAYLTIKNIIAGKPIVSSEAIRDTTELLLKRRKMPERLLYVYD